MNISKRISAAFKALSATPQSLALLGQFGGGYFSTPRNAYVDGAYKEYQKASYAHIYSNQENVRIVVDAIARAASKRSLKCYDRDENGEKSEEPNYIAAETMRIPNDWQSGRELLNAFITDKLIFDDAYLWDMGPTDKQRRYLMRVPPYAMGVSTDNSLKPTGYTVRFADGSELDLKPYEVIHFRGYNPLHNRLGVSPLETLRLVLTESSVRKAQSIDQLRGGNIKGGIITRGLEAPEWGSKARERFQDSFATRLRGTTRGEIAVLEDGMAFQEAGITPREAEMMESKKFDLALISNMYGVNPSYFSDGGALAQAREMMDEDVVDPLLGDLADVLTNQLIRSIYNGKTEYFKFPAKKITDLGALFTAGSQATGGSVLTANEFRKDYLEKEPIEGGDELVKAPGTPGEGQVAPAQAGGIPPKPASAPRGRQATPAAEVDAEKELKSMLTKAAEDKLQEAAIAETSVRRVKRAQARREAHAALFDEAFSPNGQRPVR